MFSQFMWSSEGFKQTLVLPQPQMNSPCTADKGPLTVKFYFTGIFMYYKEHYILLLIVLLKYNAFNSLLFIRLAFFA